MKQNNKLFIGITGNIGSGKSEVSSYLIEKGYTVVDADKIVKDIYKNLDFKNHMIDTFGIVIKKNIDSNEFELDRKVISDIVFADKSKLELLEKIISPFFDIYFSDAKNKILQKVVFFDIPLLFEKGYNKDMDLSVLVYCDDSIRLKRASKRDNKSEEEILTVDRNQMPQIEKTKLADYIIYNNDTKEQLRKKVDEFLIKFKI